MASDQSQRKVSERALLLQRCGLRATAPSHVEARRGSDGSWGVRVAWSDGPELQITHSHAEGLARDIEEADPTLARQLRNACQDGQRRADESVSEPTF